MVNYLVGGFSPYPSEKSWSSSVGMMKFPIYGTIKMFQTTNQCFTHEKWRFIQQKIWSDFLNHQEEVEFICI